MPAQAVDAAQADLSERQREILRRVVEEFVATGQPVGSKNLVERSGMTVSPSTVRNELAELERLGLLTHPHTSAGRVPTESGYRLYVQGLLDRLDPRPARLPLAIEDPTEVDAAFRATTEMLSQVTHLLALVSAPPLEASSVRHVEVLALQPQVVMVVVITSSGAVSKRVFALEEQVDPGLAKWAGEYLNEQLVGQQLGTRAVRQRLEGAGLPERERTFLAVLRPAFRDLPRDEELLYVGGAAGVLDDVRSGELGAYRGLVEILEKRAELLDILARSLRSRPVPFVRMGDELESPTLRPLALVGTAYGLPNRTLGAVSLVGPVRMDYEKAIRSVRAAAYELSRFVEEFYGDN